ncbi:hypothetical protein ANN_04760 [Periplaneta americana]|uniref:Reverse transcriptase n=1 Tax=Periplaneta americana TaxID=6978 RepID=A0ABQ8T9B4_PERAM|nr:hypothetical protein ANN_04760 [Periplaneta americana]
MVGNVAAVRAIPGRSVDSNRCRHCFNEIETLAHVLGSCLHGETLRNARHHKIRSAIAQALRDKGYTTYEGIHGLSKTGSCRRVDILACNNTTGYLIDPTIRFELNTTQPEDVNNEKNQIYGPTVPYYLHIDTAQISNKPDYTNRETFRLIAPQNSQEGVRTMDANSSLSEVRLAHRKVLDECGFLSNYHDVQIRRRDLACELCGKEKNTLLEREFERVYGFEERKSSRTEAAGESLNHSYLAILEMQPRLSITQDITTCSQTSLISLHM